MSRDASADILARHGRSFAWAARFLPREQARNATRLYAFCRTVDDLADREGGPTAAARLDRLSRSLGTERPREPLARAFAVLDRDVGLTVSAARQLIDGVSSDLSPVRVGDQSDLLRYAYRVGGTVGILMCDVLGVHDPKARRHAVDLGIAMQLTNIARDVGEDAMAGRRYLPARWVLAEPAEILRPTPELEASIRRCVLRLVALSEHYYASGAAGLRYLPVQPRLAITVAAQLYRAIGTRLSQRGGDYLSGRTVVPHWRKIALTLGAAVLPPATRRLAHDRSLHTDFEDLIRPAIMPGPNRGGLDHVAA
ncbi:MAG: phytoene/squalene synthase family protein [Paracoccaceae bacterium]